MPKLPTQRKLNRPSATPILKGEEVSQGHVNRYQGLNDKQALFVDRYVELGTVEGAAEYVNNNRTWGMDQLRRPEVQNALLIATKRGLARIGGLGLVTVEKLLRDPDTPATISARLATWAVEQAVGRAAEMREAPADADELREGIAQLAGRLGIDLKQNTDGVYEIPKDETNDD